MGQNVYSHTRMGVPYEYTHMGRPIRVWALVWANILIIMGQNTANDLPIYGPVPACLLRAATAISRPSEHCCMLDMPQKTVAAKAYLFTFGRVSVVVIVSL